MNRSMGLASCQFLGKTSVVVFVKEHPSYLLLVNHLLALSLNILLIFPTISLNAVAIVTILKYAQLKTKPCYFIIVVQSVIDLAVGVFGIPMFVVFLSTGISGVTSCAVVILALEASFLPIAFSTVTLSAMTMERYIAILHPYAYTTQVTRKRLLVYTTSSILVMFTSGVLSFPIPRLGAMFGAMVVAAVFFFTVFAYTRIWLVVRKLARSQNQPSDVDANENGTRMNKFLREVKQAKSCFVVVVCFFILCFLPLATILPVASRLDEYHKQAVLIWVITLASSNASVNSVIFFWTKNMFRKEAVKLLKSIYST